MGTQVQTQTIIDSTKTGGARRDRTADLLHAMQALSQLSYGPTWRRRTLPEAAQFVKKMNGLRETPDAECGAQSRQSLRFAQNCQRLVDWRGYRAAADRNAHRLRDLAQGNSGAF